MLKNFQQRSFVSHQRRQRGAAGLIQRRTIQSILLEVFVQGRSTDTNIPRGFHEIDDILARGFGMSHQEVREGAGETWQEFSIGSTGHVVLNLADDFSGGQLALSRGGGPRDLHQASHLSHFQVQTAVQKEMGQEAPTGVISARLLQKGKGRHENRHPMRSPFALRNPCLVQPSLERFAVPGHAQLPP